VRGKKKYAKLAGPLSGKRQKQVFWKKKGKKKKKTGERP